MRKCMKPGRQYFIINIDETYAPIIYEILKYGQMQKGEWPEGDISFDEWKKITFCFRWKDEILITNVDMMKCIEKIYNGGDKEEARQLVKEYKEYTLSAKSNLAFYISMMFPHNRKEVLEFFNINEADIKE